jgi:exodeoxyribonuclease V gamma subunit
MLHVHRAERADGLVDALGMLLAAPPDDPFATEVVAVPTRGMERWLTQRLSARLGAREGRSDGVCANVDFPFPQRLVGDAVALATGIDPDEDPWRPERSVWPLLEVVGESIEEPWLARLAKHLEGEVARRFASVRHIAALFDAYALSRPEMLVAWEQGQDTGGGGAALREDSAWQAELWRRLRERIGEPGPAERIGAATRRIEEEPALLGLPPRVSLFGLTRLPAGHLRVLRAIAAVRDVHLFLLHPSPALWDKVAAAPAAAAVADVRRADDPTASLPANRLLASWGRDSRELQLVLEGGGTAHEDHHHEVEHAAGTLLARIQADVRADHSPSHDSRPLLDDDDRSVQVHSCHGRARQVEVLRDAVLHLLEEDPTLEPRDVIVMCPDIETFAPLIHATFDAGDVIQEDEDSDEPVDAPGTPDLRVRLADRSLRLTNPVLGVVATLLDLAGERVTASQVLDFAGREPVRRRFRLDDDDLSLVQRWVAQSGIRWGLDAAHREPFKLSALEAGTWRFGLDRLLVGVTMSEEEPRLFGEVLPLDDVASSQAVDVAGRFTELVERLGAAVDDLRAPRPVAEWAQALGEAADRLTSAAPRDAWQRSQLQRILDDAADEAGASGTDLALSELRTLLFERLQGRPTRANFRTGHLTVCTLHPMRSVPHRVVCLLGLDDGAFPRKSPRDGDDLTLDDPHVGDRDARSEDRQLLLDALLAARERLIVTYPGNDERTNEQRPPAVPVGELLDMVDRTVRVPGDDVRKRIVVRHPLQPFDPRNFTEGQILPGRPWSFDAVTLDGARALCGDRAARAPFLGEPLADGSSELVELDALIRFVEHPVRAFLLQRLDIDLRDFTEDVDDALPVELDQLENWAVGQRLLDGVLGGAEFDACAEAEKARGTLPPGLLGERVLDKVEPVVGEIATAARSVPGGGGAGPGLLEVRVDVGGRTLTGTVRGIDGDVLRAVTYSRVGPKQRLAMWVRWLAVTAAYPEREVEAHIVGRVRTGGGDHASVTTVALRPPPGSAEERREFALEHLATLLDIHARGLREPLPLACKASAVYAWTGESKRAQAAKGQWETDWGFDKEDRDPEHQLVFGGSRPFDDLLHEPPRDDESGPDWDLEEGGRFGRYARRLWRGLLATEEVRDR